MLQLDKKIAVVTGGRSGVGRAIAAVCPGQGAEVHILDIDEAGAKNATKKINANGGIARAHASDVTDQKAVVKTFGTVGAFHILVNNAGIFDQHSITQPIGRMGEPEEVASLALYLCSDEAPFVIGCDYLLGGGFIHLNH